MQRDQEPSDGSPEVPRWFPIRAPHGRTLEGPSEHKLRFGRGFGRVDPSPCPGSTPQRGTSPIRGRAKAPIWGRSANGR
jgi:hypothetical protein